jgi:hypothetical protein
MNRAERIELTDTPMSALLKLAEGNPGAATVCAQLIKEGGAIDPDSFLGGLGNLLSLDSLGIYGSRIWMLYKDVCGMDIVRMVGLFRSHQLGHIHERVITDAIDGHKPISHEQIDDLVSKVKAELPAFAAT